MKFRDTDDGRVIIFTKDEVYISNNVYGAALSQSKRSLEPVSNLLRQVDITSIPIDSLNKFIVVLNLKEKRSQIISSVKGPNYLFQVNGEIMSFEDLYKLSDLAGPKMKRLLKL